MFDVAVIGAGPAGSTTARLLAEQGYYVALLEGHSRPGEWVNCSGIVGVEAFHRFNLPRQTVIRLIDTFRFYSPGRLDLQYKHSEPLAMIVNRQQFDVELACRAAVAGANLLTSSRITDIRVEGNYVRMEVNRKDSLFSKFAVIATGAGSKLIRQAGLIPPGRFVVGAQTECHTSEIGDVEIHLGRNIANANFAWVIPFSKHQAKIGLLGDRNASDSLRRFLQSPLLKNRVLERESPIRTSLLPLEPMPRTFRDRVLVVGEAAGQVKMTTGGGIYYGMLAAEIAAEVLHESLQSGRFQSADLALYEYRWKVLLENEMRAGLSTRSFFAKISDSKIDALFHIAQKNGIMDVVRREMNFDWHRRLIGSVFRHCLVSVVSNPGLYAKLVFA